MVSNRGWLRGLIKFKWGVAGQFYHLEVRHGQRCGIKMQRDSITLSTLCFPLLSLQSSLGSLCCSRPLWTMWWKSTTGPLNRTRCCRLCLAPTLVRIPECETYAEEFKPLFFCCFIIERVFSLFRRVSSSEYRKPDHNKIHHSWTRKC